MHCLSVHPTVMYWVILAQKDQKNNQLLYMVATEEWGVMKGKNIHGLKAKCEV